MNDFTASKLDSLLSVNEIKSFNPQYYDSKVKDKLEKLYLLLDKIKSLGEDELKILYFSVKRGTIEEYKKHNYLEEDILNSNKVETFFKEDYPDELNWYRLATSRYKNYRTILLNYKAIIYADMDNETTCFENTSLQELLDFLIYKVKEVIKMLDNNTYNSYIATNLSYKNKFGVIKRSDYWKLYPNTKEDLLSNIGQTEIDYFVKNASDKISERISHMTSGKYFECVKLIYETLGYEIGNLSNKELYLKYADGRDEGLSKINLDSREDFEKWYNDENKFGGHPWEIIVGHSYSRLNLYISKDETGYYLKLSGNQILRKIEIVKIFLTLTENNIPIEINNVDVIKNALKGNDYIGIVPNNIIPIRCGSYFKEYEPNEFSHIEDEKILDYIIWQEVEKLDLK